MHDQLHPLPLASAARFRIRHAYLVSFVIKANGCGYAQGPFWSPWRFALVALEIRLVGQGNQIEDYASSSPPSPLSYASLVAAKTRRQHCLCREVDEIWKYRMGGNLTIFDKDHTLRDREGSCSQAYGFATITMYSWWQPGEIGCAYRM